jgi:hypothetical protein
VVVLRIECERRESERETEEKRRGVVGCVLGVSV